MRKAIDAIIIEQGKLLLVKKNQTWILPGGKPEIGEDDLECLSREVFEELNGTTIKNIDYCAEFVGETPHKKDLILVKTYFAQVDGFVKGVSENDSISQYSWAKDFSKYNLSESTKEIISYLQREKYL